MTTEVLHKPVLTEKASKLVQRNVFTFYVSLEANKIQIAQAIKKQFGVLVSSVNTVNLPGKKVRRGRISGVTKGRKKAIITVSQGQNLDELKKLF